MANLMFSINAVVPLFLIMVLGFALRSRAFIGDVFVESSTKVCFYVALPCLLFLNITRSNFREAFDAPLILLCIGGILLSAALLRLLVLRFIKNFSTGSAFIQTCFHSNSVLLGLPFINNLVGPSGLSKAGAVLAFAVPLFSILSVLLLTENQQQGSGKHRLFSNIASNPLIIAALLGVVGSLISLNLPQLLERPLSYISDMAMPLALFTLGASVQFQGEAKKLRLALVASLIKLVAIPLAVVFVACLLNFDTVQMAVTLSIFAAPPAVACFPMAFQMGADHQFTSQTIVLGTALSALTMFAFVYVLRVTGWV